jgi:magnesium transporter
MLLDLKFSIGTLGMGVGAFVAALYGMNLKNFIEDSDAGFGIITLTSAALAGLMITWGMGKLRKVQRVSMWGEAGRARRTSRGSWNNIEDSSAKDLADGSRRERLKRLHEERKSALKESIEEQSRLPVITPKNT